MPFVKGNTYGKQNRGKKYITNPLVRFAKDERVAKAIFDLQGTALNIINFDGLRSTSAKVRLKTALEISKFLWATKRENTNVEVTFEDYLKKIIKEDTTGEVSGDTSAEIAEANYKMVDPTEAEPVPQLPRIIPTKESRYADTGEKEE